MSIPLLGGEKKIFSPIEIAILYLIGFLIAGLIVGLLYIKNKSGE
jgi:hypothetical protein